ncbi:tail assembly chaperone [Klebsiella aerogenes]|uniref:tail fiber assembly protein n=1 Tax=Klebsiella aerogenes TaxID=548 RepID=UPI00063C5A1E|nr:tail assembly chaperone [Klebsiella aerogenes]EKZ6147609.1 tail assembly chaperone [Klebsiella aerogenes]EKZ6284358.1 tail assembly chaperone [Klebsiella aerogenes]KLF78440.1 hypothetical protein YA40_04730 [Klebsiella aerogenes]HBW3046609.1 tail assembly chaperone [Klebsiella aerogenes]HCW3466695.1 tail assembly chaperone [Klebsiella aerogenes]
MYFSPRENAFYPEEFLESYEQANSLPDDLIFVGGEIFSMFTAVPPEGKIRGVVDGMPCWVDMPSPSPEQQKISAEQKKDALIDEARAVISIWQTELLLGTISDDDKSSLIKWIAYIKALQEVDISHAPDVNWPEVP